MRQERLIAAKYINTYLVCHTRNTTARNFNLSQVKKTRNTFSKHKKSTFKGLVILLYFLVLTGCNCTLEALANLVSIRQ